MHAKHKYIWKSELQVEFRMGGYSITRIVYKLLNNKLIAVAIERRASRHKQLSTLINHFWPKWATLFANELRVRPFLVKTNRSMDQLGGLPIGQVANWPKPAKYAKMQVAKLDTKHNAKSIWKNFRKNKN